MPILSIITQPDVNSINSAYRPIYFKVSATKSDGKSEPPAVYCDIYFNGLFYRSTQKTHYLNLLADRSEWEFDIQDLVQEYLGKFIAPNGSKDIVEAKPLIASIQVKFRSSGINTDGYIETEDIAPVQQTGGALSIAGTGYASNTFWGINATLQHADNFNLNQHLNTYKNRTWAATSYPLTHRPDNYNLSRNDSDFFPILTEGSPGILTLFYRLKNSFTWLTSDSTSNCVAVGIAAAISIPDANVGIPYSFSIAFTGSLPMRLDSVMTKPAWMSILINGNIVTLSGTPVLAATGANITFKVANCANNSEILIANSINVIAYVPPCTIVSLASTSAFPDCVVDTPYSFSIQLFGTSPFTLSNVITPPWLNINLTGNTINATGIPKPIRLFGIPLTIAFPVNVKFTITNCGGSINIDETFIVNPKVVGSGVLTQIVVSNDLNSICSNTNPALLVYTASGQLTAGQTIFSDFAMTQPLTGYVYAKENSGEVFQLNSLTGFITGTTGLIC